MHTLRMIGGGIALLAVLLLIGRFVMGASGAGLARVALIFLPIWLAAAVVNLWVGVSHAGYSVGQELPILLVVFGVPAVVALIVRARFLRS